MANFKRWLEEAKKKGTKESLPPTATSSPLRGANQDQSGFNGKNDVADYTISDETKQLELEGPDSWEQHSPAERKRTVKDLLKLGARHAAEEMPHLKIKEASMNSSFTKNRITPVNIGHNGGGIGPRDPNAPSNVQQSQNAANQRVVQLDKAAQQQKDDNEKQKEQEIAKRQKDAESRQKEAEFDQKQSQKKQVKPNASTN